MAYYEIRSKYNQKKSLMDRLRHKIEAVLDLDTVVLSLKMKHIDLLRGNAFIDDIQETFDEAYPDCMRLNIADLINILFQDFIKQVKSGTHDHRVVADFLLDGNLRYLHPLKQKQTKKESQRKLQQVTPYSFIFEDVEEEIDEVEEMDEMVIVDIAFKERFINRVKILLYDIEPHLKGENLSVEDVIVIRYLNFIERLRIEGNNRKIMEAILINLGYKKKTLE